MHTSLFRKLAPAAALLGLGLTACQPDLEGDYDASKGSADFSRYIAVGNSLTAGFSDGGLYREGQLNSYPSILAQQFMVVGGGEFNQPLFTEAQENGSGYLRLTGFTATGSPTTANVTTSLAIRGLNPTLYTRYDGRVDNLGVPGIRLSDIQTPGYGSTQGNPYFERITPTTTPTQTYFQRVKAEAATATFFSNWLGNNDVLGYATSGGAGSTITRTDTFTLKNNRIVNVLTANGAKGIVATIPDVTNIPFFTTVGPAFRATLTAANVAGVVITTGPFSTTLGTPATRKTIATTAIRDATGASGNQLFTLTASPYLPLVGRPNNGKAWRDVYNQAKPSLPAVVTLGVFLAIQGVDTTQAFGVSAGNPIPSTLVLDDAEQANVKTATTAFNSAIVAKANEKGLAVFDANTFFSQVANQGFVTNGVNNTASFISGNLFSLDGVHPTPRGYAVVANEMIRAINAKYGATIPTVNPNNYRGVRFPQ
ncbi:SGNH/GDSL hydrolase family protein [Hymenobacter pini]|uniref:SGNH/GDSL hydrolase family protein n=1 Tax=Hymenobacter pini TaxID=2880879 RepID=UPI001CF2BFE2|nr:SGNH/GDSL hydrolase family protein [Hymenobacter pini]MCA8832310.1 SGNH/GDSL hydrolase family protein [Hymenobacter pini]